MPSLLIILTLLYNYKSNEFRSSKQQQPQKKSALESNKASNLLIVCPEIEVFLTK